MKVIKKIKVKKIITTQLKAELNEEYEFKIFKLEQECEQLRFEKKKMLQQNPSKKIDITAKFEKEINSRKDHIKWYQYKQQQLDVLPIGSEIEDGEVEALIELKEGMNWDDLTKERTIMIEDGIIKKLT
ncbi:hypothetical protein GGQ92_000183 [Gracilibacillus halotolerans]|uniref:YlqD protein n=1 Tax=Gracilibacillus halotolerans TaxID=74386 RepID=A0A841RIV5_9BACI|nr:YlqD family protein [Gracilibacillus halotolerans]MBB6511416.1 hypothetical protein [Gracilibacillus halotolerans]